MWSVNSPKPSPFAGLGLLHVVLESFVCQEHIFANELVACASHNLISTGGGDFGVGELGPTKGESVPF